MYLDDVDSEEIFNNINGLKNSFSTGVDGINTKISKEYNVSLSKILPFYINNSFHSGIFPDCLTTSKTAKVIPVYKKMVLRTRFKTIGSLLNVTSKNFEACLYNQLYKFLDSNNFFDNNQFGFMKNANTSSACITHIEGTKIIQIIIA